MKNPWMSLWLSGANTLCGAAFGQAASMGRRQMNVIASKATEDMVELWFGAWMPRPQRQRKKSR